MSGDEYRTDDMALATVLRGQGFKYRLERMGHRRAVWAFRYNGEGERLDDLIDEYEDHSCKVEPRAFTRDLAEVRNELFKFLGEPERRQARRATSPDAASA